MKKIVGIIFSVLVISGCNKEDIQLKKEVAIKKTTVTEAKEYYAGRINYINHDDYFAYSNKVNNDVLIVQTGNDYETKDSVEKTKNETAMEREDFSNEEEDIKNEIEIIAQEVAKEGILESEKSEDDLIIGEEKETLVLEHMNVQLNSSEPIFHEEEKIEEIKEDIIGEDAINKELDASDEIKKGYYAPNGNYLGETKVKVIDVSYYQGDINWDVFASKADCYGVILRLGYYDTLDKKFERNINELKRLNIPYGIYLFSYATTLNGSNKEAIFTNKMIDKYELNPILGIYYDIESWNTSNGASSNDITKEEYDIIIENYINKVSNHIDNKYKVKVYSGRWYAMNRLGSIAKSYVDWVAEYNSTLKYDSSYTMWQYTSKGSIPGISGNVDISYLY